MAKKLWVENIATNPARYFQEDAPSVNYTDKSSDMFEFDAAVNILDCNMRRKYISPLFYAVAGSSLENWASLSDAQKDIGVRYFFATYALRTAIISEAEDHYNSITRIAECVESRKECIRRMRELAEDQVRLENLTQVLFSEFYEDAYSFGQLYIEAESDDIYNFLSGIAPYEGVFAAKDYYSVALKDDLLAIYNEYN